MFTLMLGTCIPTTGTYVPSTSPPLGARPTSNSYKNKYVLFPPFPLIILFVLSVPTILSNRRASNFVKMQVTEGSAKLELELFFAASASVWWIKYSTCQGTPVYVGGVHKISIIIYIYLYTHVKIL